MCFLPALAAIPAALGGATATGAATAGVGAGATAAATAGAGAGISGASALSGLGTLVSAFGALAGGVQQQRVADYQAQVAKNNAAASRQAASANAERIRDRVRSTQSSARAAFAKSGVALQGTPLAVLGANQAEGELDVLTAIYKGELSGIAQENSAALARAEGSSALTGGLIGAGSTFLTGFGNIASGRFQPRIA